MTAKLDENLAYESLDTDSKLNVIIAGLLDIVSTLGRVEERLTDLEERVQNLDGGAGFGILDLN